MKLETFNIQECCIICENVRPDDGAYYCYDPDDDELKECVNPENVTCYRFGISTRFDKR